MLIFGMGERDKALEIAYELLDMRDPSLVDLGIQYALPLSSVLQNEQGLRTALQNADPSNLPFKAQIIGCQGLRTRFG